MEKEKNLSWLWLIPAFICSIAFYALGAFICKDMGESAKNTLAIATISVLALIVLIFLASILGSLIFTKSKKKMSVAEMQNYLSERRQSVRADLEKSVRKLRRIRVLTQIYTAFIVVLAAACAFLLGATGSSGVSVVALYLFYGFFVRFRRSEKADFEGYADEKDYPQIYAVAKRAAKNIGVPGDIKIMFTYDCNAAIAKIEKVNALRLGALLLDVLTEEELYNVLVHEFAHLTAKCRPTRKEFALYGYVSNTDGSFMANFADLMFKLPYTVFAWEFIMYRITASAAVETIADSAVLEYGDAQTAVNGMAKLAYSDRFSDEMRNFITEHFCASEEMRTDVMSVKASAFRRAIEERREAWNTMLMNEIEPRTASHPIFRHRMESLGIKSFETLLPCDKTPYREECEKVLTQADKEIYEDGKESYAQRRAEEYLAPMETVNKWHESGETPPAEEARPLFDALTTLGMAEEAEALCDELMAKTDNKFALAHAHYIKGIIMLGRYDKGGIAHIYEAMDTNSNYVDWGLDDIGGFCCKMGLEKELEEYREKALVYAQDQEDKYDETGTLSAKDKISESDMPRELLDEIVGFIKRSDEKEQINAVYLVKKTITNDFSTDIFLLAFRSDSDDKACEEVYDKIFNFLDTHPTDRQFSLFVYDKSYDAALKKVKNYIVYER